MLLVEWLRRWGTPFVVSAAAACGEAPVAPPPVAAPPAPPPPPSPSAVVPGPSSNADTAPMTKPGSFEDDLAFLSSHGAVIVLSSPSGARVAVSPTYQGRVMTSAVAAGDKSLGFVHRPFIEAGKTGTQFDNYGGEDRFWLGPEGGQFGLYFPPGKAFEFGAWQTPDALQTGAWHVSESGPDHVVFDRTMRVVSHAGTTFDLRLVRTVRLLDETAVAQSLGAAPGPRVKWVAFETRNEITNIGSAAWTKKTGMPSVWILGMYAPSADTFVAIPFERSARGEVVNDRYFGHVGADRLVVDEPTGLVVFRCDGARRGKIGVGPRRARSALGSYSASEHLLTLVTYDKPAGARDYVNSMWESQKDPFAGDVVNSYNDGPTEPGKPALGGFYEIETSSPAAALSPGQSLVHTHRTFHLVGEAAALDPLARASLGVPVARITIAPR